MKTTIVSALVTLLGVFGVACSTSTRDADNTATKGPVAATAQSTSKSETTSNIQEDWLVIPDQEYIPVIHTLSRMMQTARQAFVKKEPASAAFAPLRISCPKRPSGMRITNWAAQSSPWRNHTKSKQESWVKNETIRTGDEMNAVALFLEQCAHWTASEAKSGVSAVVGDTRMLDAKLTEGSNYAVEVGKSIDELGKAVPDLDRGA